VALYGGVGYKEQIDRLKKGVDVIIATPGRLLDMREKKHADLSHIKMLVLDEADRMLDMGFWPDVRKIVNAVPKQRQNMLFSATLDDAVLRVIGGTLDDPVSVDVAPASTPVDQVTQHVYAVNASQKTELLVALLNSIEEYHTIIFTRTKMRADRLSAALKSSGIRNETIHSDRSQQQRSRVGVTTRMCGVPLGGIRVSAGRMNAAVFPVPVCAHASTSRPSRTCGIACACIGVGSS
jgi:ATP-dependent RNA helicase RhlE